MTRDFLSPSSHDTGTPRVRRRNARPDHATLVRGISYIRCRGEVTILVVVSEIVWQNWVDLVVQNATIETGFTKVTVLEPMVMARVEGIASGNRGDRGSRNGDWILRVVIGSGEDSFVNVFRVFRMLRS